jgi:ABC-type transport system involved in multi-copper enzyme maturation permease subunit
MLVVLLVYVAVTIFCSTLARTQGTAAWLSFAALVLVAGVGSIPRIGEYFPGQLFAWGGNLALGGEASNWPALGVSLGLIAVSLTAAWLVFRRQELS